jgi:hypothetical protein
MNRVQHQIMGRNRRDVRQVPGALSGHDGRAQGPSGALDGWHLSRVAGVAVLPGKVASAHPNQSR